MPRNKKEYSEQLKKSLEIFSNQVVETKSYTTDSSEIWRAASHYHDLVELERQGKIKIQVIGRKKLKWNFDAGWFEGKRKNNGKKTVAPVFYQHP